MSECVVCGHDSSVHDPAPPDAPEAFGPCAECHCDEFRPRKEAAFGKFVLEIQLGNAMMQSGGDVAAALFRVASEVEEGRVEGIIRDLNGNTVGRYENVADE